VKHASNDTLAGRRYLDLQREAKCTGRPTDELIQLYALECFLDRLVHSKFAETFILKGGVLLAALDARRPTVSIVSGLGHSDMVTQPDAIRALVASFNEGRAVQRPL
jgi:hypothetical protein